MTVHTPDSRLTAAYADRDWAACAEVIEESWMDLLFHGPLELLVHVVFDLPDDVRTASPVLGHLAEAFGAIPIGTVPVEIPSDPDDIAELAVSDRMRSFLLRATLAFMAWRSRGRHVPALGIANAATAVVNQTSPVPFFPDGDHPLGASTSDLRTFFYLQVGLTAQIADSPELAQRTLKQAWRERDHDRTGFAARDTAINLAVEAGVAGRPEAARRWLTMAEGEPHAHGTAEAWAVTGVEIAELIIALETADPDDFTAARERVADGSVATNLWPLRMWALARTFLTQSTPEEALALIASVESQLPIGASGPFSGIVAMLRGDAYQALSQGTRAHSELSSAPPTNYFGRVSEARLALLSGDNESAHAIASETVSSVCLTRRTRIEALLIEAVADLRLQQPRAAGIERAVSLIRDDGPRTAVLAVPRTALTELADAVPEAADLLTIRKQLPVPDIYPDSIELIRLTKRESEVLDQLAAGLSRAEIARTTFLSENTIKQQMRSLYAKLGVASRADAVTRAREAGLLPVRPPAPGTTESVVPSPRRRSPNTP